MRFATYRRLLEKQLSEKADEAATIQKKLDAVNAIAEDMKRLEEAGHGDDDDAESRTNGSADDPRDGYTALDPRTD